MIFRIICTLLAGALLSPLHAQGKTELGSVIFSKVSPSVFLVEVENNRGAVIRQGTAFLIGDGLLLTNAHVANAGKAFLKTDHVRLQCLVERQDTINDLALLKIPASMSSSPLKLSQTELAPGTTVFAIGNPEGLERTISQGLYTGIRKHEQKELMQISAPISPGSSGGPIVNSEGEVVGVAVAILRAGQNLNFAVPAKIVRAFLSNEKQKQSSDIASLLATIDQMIAARDRDGVSLDEDSPYQRHTTRIKELLEESLRAATTQNSSTEALLALSQKALLVNSDSDVGVKAAQLAVALSHKPDPRALFLLAATLLDASRFEQDIELRKAQTAQAETALRKAISFSHPPSVDQFLLLARIQLDTKSKPDEAYLSFQEALKLSITDPAKRPDCLLGLYRSSAVLNRIAEAKKWFGEFATSKGKLTLNPFVWSEYAEFLRANRLYGEAAAAVEKVIHLQGNYLVWYTWYDVAHNYWRARDYDKALAAARKCIEVGSTQEKSEHFLSSAHYIIARVLYDRGVYEQAIVHAKQSIALSSDNSWAYWVLASSLHELKRPAEALSAIKTAIRINDGKEAVMHYTLGLVHSELEDWAMAGNAFEKSFRIDQTAPTAFNIALCLHRQGIGSEAIRWYETALRLDPNVVGKEEIQEAIRRLRR